MAGGTGILRSWEHTNTSANHRANAQRREIERPERAPQALVGLEVRHAFSAKEVHEF